MYRECAKGGALWCWCPQLVFEMTEESCKCDFFPSFAKFLGNKSKIEPCITIANCFSFLLLPRATAQNFYWFWVHIVAKTGENF